MVFHEIFQKMPYVDKFEEWSIFLLKIEGWGDTKTFKKVLLILFPGSGLWGKKSWQLLRFLIVMYVWTIHSCGLFVL